MPHTKNAPVAACALLAAGMLAGGPAAAAGIVDAHADIAIGNLRFSFDDPDAFLVWDDDWFGTVAAYAQDTDSGADADYAEYLGNDGIIEAEAQTAHVYSKATYGVQDGQNVAIEPDASIGASTLSDLYLAGKHKQADGFANADFDNFFYIDSANPLGPPSATVLTTIELDYAGLLDAYANEQGYFEVFAGALLELWEVDQINGDVTDLVDFDLFFDEASGTNTAYYNELDGTLTVTGELFYYDVYWLYAEADSEVYGAVPVAGTLPLMLLGAGVLAWRRRR
jgi:hypothetical protein